jgi:hypothetical protein
MTNHIAGKRVLIVEDEQIIAEHLASQMTAEGAEVIGPVATVDAALDLISNTHLDGARSPMLSPIAVSRSYF